MVLSVKGGHVRPTDIRDLRGVLEREEDAVLAGFISIKEPTKAMRRAWQVMEVAIIPEYR